MPRAVSDATRYFEFIDGNTSKVWEVTIDGALVTVRFGRIGTAGQSRTKQFENEDAAQEETDKLIGRKTKKGYELIQR